MISESVKPWLVGLLTASCIGYFLYDRAARRPVAFTGTIAESPMQATTRATALERAGYAIEPVAAYTVRARVLSTERYRMGREADLSPVDFALGWGLMAETAVLDRLSISQSNRWYQYRWENAPPIEPSLIISSSANTHLVPADEAIKDRLLNVRAGSVVTLTGYLVNIKHADGWSWRSSLRRDDSGDGSCELMWVTDLSVE